jgi:hypothetical protein
MRRTWGVLLALGLAVLVGCGAAPASPLPPRAASRPLIITPVEPPTVTTPPTGEAVEALASLPVKGRAPMTGYNHRAPFGPPWADVDHNGCDTRNDTLARDLDDETFKPGTHDCIVTTGTLHDPYTGKTTTFTRGQTTSDDVQIDHIVSLGNAWATGAQQLNDGQRLHLANDLINLQATEGKINQQKSDADYATWKPPDRTYWCVFVSRQIQVKTIFRLWVTQPEHDAMAETLATCPGQDLPR